MYLSLFDLWLQRSSYIHFHMQMLLLYCYGALLEYIYVSIQFSISLKQVILDPVYLRPPSHEPTPF